ncbi:hypothetical protein N7489_008831 [Penicillium chrysogenum]|uniref:uncharacterized protein n=1 Tax=Penicillium chrysogenum TaxID=5076 RepID=UPI0024DF125F|nr:uncharacterized protein N7489_008831 [Penicillium chrysogenum]KAJ5228123.1 hypothetical protein N7489_008831 [Penicillium chrysogenum]
MLIKSERQLALFETTRRLVAQIANEKLGTPTLDPSATASQCHMVLRNPLSVDGKKIKCRIRDAAFLDVAEGKIISIVRPGDLIPPVLLQTENTESVEEWDPGNIFRFIGDWLPGGITQHAQETLIEELQNSVANQEKWLEIARKSPTPSLDSPFIAWERSIYFGHPTHPITSSLRTITPWTTALGPVLTDILKSVLPPDLWIFDEVAGVSGGQDNFDEARHLSCILRHDLQDRARENGEALVVAAALFERPIDDHRTYAEILFGLRSLEEIRTWFRSVLIARWAAGTSSAEAIVGLIILGNGQGAVMKGLLVRSQFPVKPMHISISTGLVIFIQTVGDIFGIVIFTAIGIILSDVQKVKTQFKGEMHQLIIEMLPNTVVYDREGRDHGSGRTDDLGITFFWPTQFIDRDNSNPQHQAMVDEFVGVLESFLGTKRVNISLAERWEQCPPSEVNGKPLKQYLSKVGIQFTLIWK